MGRVAHGLRTEEYDRLLDTMTIMSTLSRRNAGLPTLDALDPSLLEVCRSCQLAAAALPFAAAALFPAVYALQWYALLPVVIVALFIFSVSFLHDVAHGSAGLAARGTHAILFLIGVLLLQSGHAFRYSHLFHHTHCLEDDDLEGAPARMDFWSALASGPAYLPRLWVQALRRSPSLRERRWMVAELVTIALLVLLALWLTRWSFGPLLYCVAVVVGSWLYPLTTAYFPHYKPGERPLEQARTLRGRIVPVLFMNLTYHLEHHLYPQVPGANLRRLACRLDPLLAAKGFRPTVAY